jgi:recombination endonuclease VII
MARSRRVKPKPVKTKGGCIDCKSPTRLSYRPGPRCATCHKVKKNAQRTAVHDAYVLKTYGITGDEYWALYEAQGGECAICGRAKGLRKRLSVDHDHRTGEVRGLLCTPCNRGILGHVRDDVLTLIRAIRYLIYPPARRVLAKREWKV